MRPFLLRVTNATVEYAVACALLALSVVLFREAIRLDPGWGYVGPQAGFFPFFLTILMVLGLVGVLVHAFRDPDRKPFFEASQEIVDLLKVGLPVAALIFVIPWLGMYISAALYIGLFMAWYGKFRWRASLAGAVLLGVILWVILSKGFNISMPMSIFYRQGLLPV